MRVAFLASLFAFIFCIFVSLIVSVCSQASHIANATCLGHFDPASTAHLSPVVFSGKLWTVYDERDGDRIRATFDILQRFKHPGGGAGGGKRRGGAANPSLKEKVDVEFVQPSDSNIRIRHHHGNCVVPVSEETLQFGQEYIIFATPRSRRTGHNAPDNFMAIAEPIRNTGRNRREIKRVLCKGCATPPAVRGLKDVRMEERKRLRLQCQLSGNPPPTVEWYKDGLRVDGTKGRIRVRTKKKYSRLIIKRVRLHDNGEYECRATNVVSKDYASMKALVTVAKRSLTTQRPSPKPTKASSPWPIDGVPCPNPEFCLNNGLCIFYAEVREYVCHCAEGFIGLRCDYKDVSMALGDMKPFKPPG